MIRSKASPEFHNEPQHATACRSWDLVPRFVKVVNDPDRILDEEQARHCDSATMQQPVYTLHTVRQLQNPQKLISKRKYWDHASMLAPMAFLI